MGIRFPSLEFFQALQQKIKDDPEFEKLGVCDTTFGVRVGDALFSLHFEVYGSSSTGAPTRPTRSTR
ncbi:MAG: hypothetical protein JRG76_10090 [Deltaproteobacteria bacterium]|nr:hypothetical protein [Deltaproteobacteria bacterium]